MKSVVYAVKFHVRAEMSNHITCASVYTLFMKGHNVRR
jgi:hypothetical protein